ncbi:Suppressor of the cold-sensitive snRNP bioproteinsis mutant brr1-1 [Perkinsus chesapeaki]|uniref:subtilisin n=1 Tax=Perkinsus chesapeaki TaxID=330153 RepID=A0A7J6N342_PERCH|nr:Suppressor of the cold-sensitive snRNP bioproteinsis mutant brr1-1 [Perkinsus chesapeaki]
MYPFSSPLICAIAISSLHGAYPNDEYYWAEQRDYFNAIRVPRAWRKCRGHKRSIKTVAIIDSGMDSTHPDLKANAVVGYNVVDKNTDTHDRANHGTAMAGVIGAVINNTIGIAGITDYVNLIPIYDGEIVSDKHAADAIDYAVRAQADVIFYSSRQREPFGGRVTAALKKASQAGIPFVCPAGNDGKNISEPGNAAYPCKYTRSMDVVICVAATFEDSMVLRKRSNYAPFIDVAAPGGTFTTAPKGGYSPSRGTSPAAAIVAGVIAMMKSVGKSPLTVKEVKSILKETGVPGVTTPGAVPVGFGRLDVWNAIKRVLP